MYPGATYISVRFADFNLPEGDMVIVHSPDMSTSFEYTGRGRSGLGEFHSSPIPGNTAIVEYISTSLSGVSSQGFGYKISGYVRGFRTFEPVSICGNDNSLPAKCYINNTLPLAYEKARSVARLLINGISSCTGWLVGSKGLLITNNHCVSTKESARNIDVEFDVETPSCKGKCFFRCKGKMVATSTELIATSQEFDYSLVQLPKETTNLAAFNFLQIRESGPELGEQIYIPQHPRGFPKRIAIVEDDGLPATVKSLNGSNSCGVNQVGYTADTEPGSSGSPVLSAVDNTVVALHHCGGCENTAVNIMYVVNDLRNKGVELGDMLVGSN
jgi:V8-like Glu-specific endopeptidase